MSSDNVSAAPGRVLVIERNATVRERIRQSLMLARIPVSFASSRDEAVGALATADCDVIVAELGAVGLAGLATLGSTPGLGAGAQLVVGLDDDECDQRLAVLRQGAQHCLARPYEIEELLLVVERCQRAASAERERASLSQVLGDRAESAIVGRSPAAQRLRELVGRAAATRGHVLLVGETGTGRELVARTIHALSPRAGRPFRSVECAGVDEATLELELFGHAAAGARAVFGQRGLLAEVEGGTLLLKDAASLSPALQARLARVVQDRTLAATDDSPSLDFRIIATLSEGDLAVAGPGGAGARLDLLGRGGAFQIMVPPLRERRSDIPLLVAHLRARIARTSGAEPAPIPSDAISTFLGYEWPGNIRQLEHELERLQLMPGSTGQLAAAAGQLAGRGPGRALLDAAEQENWSIADLEREYILRVLEQSGGHQSKASEVLGIDRRTLYRKLRQYRAQDERRASMAGPSRTPVRAAG